MWLVGEGHKVNLCRAQDVALVPQRPVLPPRLTVRELLDYAAFLRGRDKDRVDELIAVMLLSEVVNRRVKHLSGGEAQRVALAVALCTEPPVLLMDEPTTGLDPARREDLLQYVVQTARERVVVMSTHLADDVLYADRVAVLHSGQLLHSGELKSFIGDCLPTSAAVTQAYRQITEHLP